MPTGDGGILQGTLDLMFLRTLASMGPQHGFGLAKRSVSPIFPGTSLQTCLCLCAASPLVS